MCILEIQCGIYFWKFSRNCVLDYNVYFYMKQWPVDAAKLANPLITLSRFPGL